MKLNKLFDNYFNDYLKYNPLEATFYGIHTYDNQLPDIYSEEYKNNLIMLLKNYLIKSDNIQVYSHIDYINLKSFKYIISLQLEEVYLPFNELPINQMNNIFLKIMSLILESDIQPIKTIEDINKFEKRMSYFPQLIKSMIKLMKKGIVTGRVLPIVITKQVIKQIEDLLNNKQYKSLKTKLKKNYKRLVNIIKIYFIPIAENTIKFLINDYLPNSRSSIGYCHIPLGDKMYEYLVKSNINFNNLSIKKIFNIGLNETNRILKEMNKLSKKLEIKNYRTDPQFYKKNNKEVLDSYKKMKQYINTNILPKYFGDLRPKFEYKIEAVPKFNEEFTATAYYIDESIDNKRPGIFYINLRNLDEHPVYCMEALTLHEGNPGHHYQISLSQNNPEIPKFRSFNYNLLNSFIEGWGLYCESLGDYNDDYSRMGKYNYEIMRASRLVIDTGIHYYGWDFNKSKSFLTDLIKISDSEADSEIYRYISIPGQALSYKIGELSILTCRDKFLKKNNNIIDFHKKIMGLGPVPLCLLNEAMLN